MVCLWANSNKQGAHWFLNLITLALITSNGWEELPMSLDAILRINTLRMKQGMPSRIIFRKGNTIEKIKTSSLIYQ